VPKSRNVAAFAGGWQHNLSTDLDFCGLTQSGYRLDEFVSGATLFKELIMSRIAFTGIGTLAGIIIGAAAVTGINAQGKGPGAYAVVDISEISDPATFKTLLPKAGQANDQFGGKFVVRTENIVALDGAAPKRFVLIAFDSMDKAKAWDKSPLQDEVNAIRRKSTKSRTFLVDSELQ
jgi:uncharacterized protein (DUF1330 family)